MPEPCTVSSEMSWKNHDGLMTDSQLNQPLSSIDHDDAEAGSLVIALGDDAMPSRKVSFVAVNNKILKCFLCLIVSFNVLRVRKCLQKPSVYF